MKKLGGLPRSLLHLIVLSTLILVLLLVLQLLMPAGQATQIPAPPANLTSTASGEGTPYSGAGTGASEIVTKPAGSIPYPAPETESPQPTPPPPEETQTDVEPALPVTPPPPAGQAAALHKGDIWLVEPGVQPIKLTEFGDVFDIFSWNREGTRLLFGRGQNEQAWGYTTELWLLELTSGETSRLTRSGLVKSASWSPVDDRLAYCEYGNVLRIIGLDGQLRFQREQVLCMFTWSPDGEAIALESYTSDMLDSDGLANTVLGVWWLQDDRLQLFSDAKDEVHASPIWSLDGKRIMFDRIIYDTSKADQREQGLYIADLGTDQIKLISASPSQAIIGLLRSPQVDLVVYRLGKEVFVMDFEGGKELVGQAEPPYFTAWLQDGKTLLLHIESGSFQLVPIDTATKGVVVGGGIPTMGQFEFYFRPGG